MPRLSTSSNDSLSDQFSKRLTFFGLVGVVMAALSFKERWDAYRQVPSEPNDSYGPPAYSDEEGLIGLDGSGGLNTDLPASIGNRASRRRNRGCCVCCGVDCSIFWKSLAVVLLLFTVWNGSKLFLWLIRPTPTGLEHMPEFSKSLGCLANAPYFWQGQQEILYTIPVGSEGEHSLDISGGAGGTLVLAPSDTEDETLVTVKFTVRASDEARLDGVTVSVPESSADAEAASYWRLSTPADRPERHHRNSCTRYDIVVYIPPTLKKLTITAQSVIQLQYSDSFASSPRSLDDLQIAFNSNACMDVLLPTAHLSALNTLINMRSGYLVGSSSIVNSTTIDTSLSTTVSKLNVVTNPYSGAAYLKTMTGASRSDFSYANVAHREIQSTHEVMGNGDLYLTYTDAMYNGLVDLHARSFSARGLQGVGTGSDAQLWAGDRDGADRLKVSSSGWAGLYF